jgi:metallo-beta-lactamase class B
MKKSLILGAAVVALAMATASAAQDAQQRVEWNRPFEPFRIGDNVYYVGTAGLSAFLITDPGGHVLIDGGLPESAPLIAASIRRLGFRVEDVRFLLINHAHADHSGGLAELKRLSGARLLASAADRADLESGRVAGRPQIFAGPPVQVDRIVEDGETLRVGRNRLTANLTPGHTRGCTSWSYRTRDRHYLFACSLTVAGQNLIDDPTYPQAAADFGRSFARLRRMRADVFLTFHPGFFDLEARRARQRAGEEDAFVDPAELGRQLDRAEAAFGQALTAQRQARR